MPHKLHEDTYFQHYPIQSTGKPGFVQSDPVQKTPVHERSPNVKFGQVKLPYTMQCIQRVHSLLLVSSLRPVRVYSSQQFRYGALATTASGARSSSLSLGNADIGTLVEHRGCCRVVRDILDL